MSYMLVKPAMWSIEDTQKPFLALQFQLRATVWDWKANAENSFVVYVKIIVVFLLFLILNGLSGTLVLVKQVWNLAETVKYKSNTTVCLIFDRKYNWVFFSNSASHLISFHLDHVFIRWDHQ